MMYCANPHHSFDGNFPIMEQSVCIGSQCMAWIFAEEDILHERTGAKTGHKRAVMHQTNEPLTCEYCDGTGRSEIIDDDGDTLPCPECEGEGNGFKYAPAGYCGLVRGQK